MAADERKKMGEVKVLVFAGSTRKGSFNKKLAKIATEAARAAGAEVTHMDLRDLPMPLYDGDLEATEGLPPNGRKFKDLLLAHDAFLIASPEYNSSISGVLKNAIDWASRPVPGEKPLECFTGKIVGLCSASPGGVGGMRGLFAVRGILTHIGSIVLPAQVTVSHADQAFDEQGRLKDPNIKASIDRLAAEVIKVASKLKS
jgi:chromate reductase, NAD(P)H dehydrogenase (quinone)